MDQPTNLNLFSPNKFLITIPLFPTVQFFAQDCEIPAVSIGKVKMSTNKNLGFPDVGDKLDFEDLTVNFILDEDMAGPKEIYQWMWDATDRNRKDFNPFQDMTITALTNNSNANFRVTYKHCVPYSISRVDMSTKRSEDQPNLMTVQFAYSSFKIG